MRPNQYPTYALERPAERAVSKRKASKTNTSTKATERRGYPAVGALLCAAFPLSCLITGALVARTAVIKFR